MNKNSDVATPTKIISLAKGLVSAPYKETKKSKSPKERKEEGWRRGF